VADIVGSEQRNSKTEMEPSNMKIRMTQKKILVARDTGSHKKTIAKFTLITADLDVPVRVRWFVRRSSMSVPDPTVYCNVWIHAERFDISGRGRYGGGGINMNAAAFQGALDSCGVELYGDDDCRSYVDDGGDSAVDSACEAIAKSMGYLKFKIVREDFQL